MQLKADSVAVGAGDGVAIGCTSRTPVGTSVLWGRGGRAVGELGVNSMLWVKEQAASSMNPMVEATLEIFIDAMLP